MSGIRALVVDDSLTIRKRIIAILDADPDITVVGEATDGKAAIDLCRALRPDVITLDMMLPVMTGLEATEYIMAYCPTPILIVSASTNRGEIFRTYDALAAGAVDVLEKPLGDEPEGVWDQALVANVKLVSRIRVITHMLGRLPKPPLRAAAWVPPPVLPNRSTAPYRLVAIGTSTGGPAACMEVLRSLPPRFPLPILVVIHIGTAFGVLLAEWLDTHSSLRVALAQDGEPLPPVGHARVLLAPPEQHLIVDGGRVRLSNAPARHSCKPSVDVLFESLAEELGAETIACLLTGMGRDGADGLLTIRQKGGRTLAQDEASSVIFGMPREAIRMGAAEQVLSIGQIPSRLVALARGAERGSE